MNTQKQTKSTMYRFISQTVKHKQWGICNENLHKSVITGRAIKTQLHNVSQQPEVDYRNGCEFCIQY